MADNFHQTFDRTVNDLRVLSYGGGAPRWVRIMRTDRDDMAIQNLTVEDCRDLHFVLGRLIALHGGEA